MLVSKISSPFSVDALAQLAYDINIIFICCRNIHKVMCAVIYKAKLASYLRNY